MVARMRRIPLWLVLVGGAVVVVGVLIQAFTIAAYVRSGLDQDWLDAHGGFSMIVHIGQLLIVIGAIWAFWGQLDRGRARRRVPRPLRRAARVPRRHGRGGQLDQRPARLPRADRAARGGVVLHRRSTRARAGQRRPRQALGRVGVGGGRLGGPLPRRLSRRWRTSSTSAASEIAMKNASRRPFHGSSSNCLPPT